MKKKIFTIETVAVLKYRYQDIEIHLKPSPTRGPFPLNWLQIRLYKFLGFDYIDGTDYIFYMGDKFKDTNQKWKCHRCGEFVDMKKKRCKCKKGPSPWEPVS